MTNTTLVTDELPLMQTIDSKLPMGPMGTIRHGRFHQSDGGGGDYNLG